MTADAPSRRQSWWVWPLGLYLLLLLASHLTRWSQTWDPPPLDGRLSIQTPVLKPGAGNADEVSLVSGEGEIRLAWWQWLPADGTEGPWPTVLLVHGSPGDGSNFNGLGPLLAAEGYRVLAPDLPGFGASSPDLPDYSARVHAGYLKALLDHLGIDRVHLLGFSLGGAVVAHLTADLDDRVRSLTLLAATGVQELELLGSYRVNHGIHGAQLAALQLLQQGVPHFGRWDRRPFHLSYARNFFDTDQRPVRSLLEDYDGPALVLHSKDDVLVPYEAALEHHRILPQSRLVSFDSGNHFLVFSDPGGLVGPLVETFKRAETGSAVTRAEASAERLTMATQGAPHRLPRAMGPTLAVWIFLLAVATLVSEDLTCLAAGLLVAQGSLGFAPAVFACALGIFIGDLGLFFLGRLGRPFLHRAPLRWLVTAKDLERSEVWFAKRGPWAILISRFMPGLRVPTYVSAGLLGMGILWFAVSLLAPILLWTPLLVGLAWRLGDQVTARFEALEAHALPTFLALLIGLWLLLLLSHSVATWSRRRLWVGRFKRWTQWEFWPRWAFYPPVVAYILKLAVEYRRPTLFTAANPGIGAAGGLVGESKSDILRRLSVDHVAPWIALPPASDDPSDRSRRELLEGFLDRQGGLPVVLKPDVGERGAGVTIARGFEEVNAFLDTCRGPAIAQRYISGVELGVFWLRLPDEPRGRIFSITHKQLPEVVGDGESTLERLILNDPRAVAMAPTYLARFADELETVLPAGSTQRLVEVGTHCLGAVFVDGERYRTPELERAVETIARGFEGFYFGRFDLRAPSFEHFQRGERISVLELNGVTSEATHIYDPKYKVWQAWGILFEQWRLAYEIGRQNCHNGHSPASLGEIWRLFRSYRARKTGQ